MIVGGEIVDAGAGVVMDLPVGGEREAERPPAHLGHLRAADLAAVATATDLEIGPLLLRLRFGGRLVADEHPRPVFLESEAPLLRVILAGDHRVRVAAGAEAEGRAAALLPLIHRRQIDAGHDARGIADADPLPEVALHVEDQIVLLHFVAGATRDAGVE